MYTLELTLFGVEVSYTYTTQVLYILVAYGLLVTNRIFISLVSCHRACFELCQANHLKINFHF